MLVYEKKFGSFYLLGDNGDILYMGEEVGILFSVDECNANGSVEVILHKHGDPEMVQDVCEIWQKALRAQGDDLSDKMAKSFHVITSSEWDIDKLNRVLDTSGYLKVVMGEMGIDIEKLLGSPDKRECSYE